MTNAPATIREGLAQNLGSIPGLTAYDTEPDVPKVPCAWPWPQSDFINRETMHTGILRTEWTVSLLVAAADTGKAQNELDVYLTSTSGMSVMRAIETDQTLGGAASNCIWKVVRRYDGNYVMGGNNYFAAEIDVTVYGTG